MSQGDHSKCVRNAFLIAMVPVVVCCGVLFFFDPNQYHFYPTCIFHQATGLLCPGCGSLRAIHQLLHGHLVTAFRFNPLLVVSMPALTTLSLVHMLRKQKSVPAQTGLWPRWLWALGIALVVVSIWRNLPGAPDLIVPPDVPTGDGSKPAENKFGYMDSKVVP